MKIEKKTIFHWIKDTFLLLLGNAMLGFLVAAFVIPHNILVGGSTAIGIILSAVLPLSAATIVLIFNLLMLLLGAITLGKKFFVATVASSVLSSNFAKVSNSFNLPSKAKTKSLTLVVRAYLLIYWLIACSIETIPE